MDENSSQVTSSRSTAYKYVKELLDQSPEDNFQVSRPELVSRPLLE
jgi:hypothetical protein